MTVLSVRDLGHASVEGESTTCYLARCEPQLACPRRAGQPAPPIESTTMWLDAHRRLVRVRHAEFDNGKTPAALLKVSPELAVARCAS